MAYSTTLTFAPLTITVIDSDGNESKEFVANDSEFKGRST